MLEDEEMEGLFETCIELELDPVLEEAGGTVATLQFMGQKGHKREDLAEHLGKKLLDDAANLPGEKERDAFVKSCKAIIDQIEKKKTGPMKNMQNKANDATVKYAERAIKKAESLKFDKPEKK